MSTSPGTTEKRTSLTGRDEKQDNAAEVERLIRERTAEIREENDVLRRENAELRQIEMIYASAPVGLCLLGTDTRYLHVNQRFAEMDGFSVEEHIGKRVRELVPDLADAAEELARAVVATGKPALDIEVQGETPAQPGEQRYWNESWRPVTDSQGRVLAISIVAEDITERKRAEEAFQRYAKNLGLLHHDLEISNREANLYLDILTHDIGNTENVSNLYADLLIESLDGEAAGYAKKLQRSIRKSIEILGTVSTIRRIHRTKTELKPTDLDAAVRGVMEDYRTSIFLYNGANYQVQADDLLPVVFDNLIGNAVKFGGPDVEIAIRIEEDDGFVQVSIEDTGPGVPDDDKNEIFHCYEMKKRGVGKGLGLYLVKILVERYGGTIWAEDRVPGRPDEGAAFKFTLKPASQTR
ncbi:MULTISPECIES: PAS domain-containing sensor histidine kinase [unclassified Methanoculleus]|uniref:PAS domain-containing sensor histidine kinase n=1 Tax=unclassified Methanoculleus TaxID=2619537 RepID=UPI0025F79075|nr:MULTISPECIES: PAS domain-containing sensor histidine kinase [unclassified Methanoculleus]